ncbi:MAG: metallophosphoesterase [Porphyromonas sp.]|nr:metallophosphoesterase [Porphyromonas sp.]
MMSREKVVTIAIASDVHLMAPSLLIQEGEAFQRALEADRKLLCESETLVDKLIEELQAHAPDLLLIPGDLTKDGERLSHELFAEKLQELRESGIQTLVVPGNHDIYNPHARVYDGDNHAPTDQVSPETFAEIYKDYGYGGPHLIERGPRLSYVAEPIEDLWVLAIDSCRYETNNEDRYPYTGGEVTLETILWVEKIAERAKKKGKRLLAMMHHGILEHFPVQTLLAREYLVKDWIKVASRLANAGVRVVFTGHFHAQDVAALRFPKGLLYDVETGSIVTYPSPYRIVHYYPDRLEIESHHIALQSEITNGLTLQEYGYQHLEEGLPHMIAFIIGYIQKYYPGKISDEVAANILEMVPHFTSLLMDIYSGHLEGDEVGLAYNHNPDEESDTPYSGDQFNELRQFVSSIMPQYAPIFTLIEGALHSTILPDNDLTISLT